MKLARRERALLALCFGHCDTCSAAQSCRLKTKISHLHKDEIDTLVDSALAEYRARLNEINN